MPNWTISDLLKFQQRGKPASHRGRKSPKLEQTPFIPSHGEVSLPEIITAAITVRFTHIRKRPLDPDDLCPKYVIDALCRIRDLNDPTFRILPGDTAKDIRVEHFQRKTAPGESEHYIIDIFPNHEGLKSCCVS